ncbi:MAG: hypothetical protein HY695_18790 [Deltaproteobacteria bacterium]|nr:hypothetical protein [Deltaproteobacteria bacterium]
MKAVLALIIIYFSGPSALLGSQAAAQPWEVEAIKAALIRYLCFEVYWHGSTAKQGIALPLKLRVEENPKAGPEEGKKFTAWIEELKISRGDRIGYFFTGTVKNNSAEVNTKKGFNLDVSPAPTYLQARRRFETGPAIKEILLIPTDCTPRYDPPTPKKKQMIELIMKTIKNHLSGLRQLGINNYPPQVSLLIADFNEDYPYTFVLIERPHEIWEVSLEDPNGGKSQTYRAASNPDLAEDKQIIAKIRKHAIKRKITLEPPMLQK